MSSRRIYERMLRGIRGLHTIRPDLYHIAAPYESKVSQPCASRETRVNQPKGAINSHA